MLFIYKRKNLAGKRKDFSLNLIKYFKTFVLKYNFSNMLKKKHSN